MMKPIDKKWVLLEHDDFNVKSYDFKNYVFLPQAKHPGGFGFQRKFDVHCGVDLYTLENEEVFNMKEGLVVGVFVFTGKEVGSPWWNETWAVAVEDELGVWVYGEIAPHQEIQEGKLIKSSASLGYVKPVLKKDKGRPMNMLHMQRHVKGSNVMQWRESWLIGKNMPSHLKDPFHEMIVFLDR